MSSYQQSVNAERLARQAPSVKKIAKDIFDAVKMIETYLYWAIDPAEKDAGQYYCRNLLERAHELVDLAHEFRAALKANPPPKEDEDGEDAAA